MQEPQRLLTQELIFYGSHLVWVYALWALWAWYRGRRQGLLPTSGVGPLAFRLGLAALFVWMRFVEPQWIVQRETDTALGTGTRVVLISDLHLGLYKGPDFVGRLAERINALRPDCVLIAGDFLYAPDAPLEVLFGRFKAIQAPVYAVLGNHDDHELAGRRPGGGDSGAVIEGLARAGVSVIESRIVNCGKVAIGGIGDQWSGREDFRAAQAYRGAEPLVLLTHNPDTAFGMPLHLSPLLLSGHTHGGQIRLPLVYRHAMPVKGPFDRGLLNSVDWHAQPAGRPAVFTSSGVGETALPMRLLNPPVIDLLLL